MSKLVDKHWLWRFNWISCCFHFPILGCRECCLTCFQSQCRFFTTDKTYRQKISVYINDEAEKRLIMTRGMEKAKDFLECLEKWFQRKLQLQNEEVRPKYRWSLLIQTQKGGGRGVNQTSNNSVWLSVQNYMVAAKTVKRQSQNEANREWFKHKSSWWEAGFYLRLSENAHSASNVIIFHLLTPSLLRRVCVHSNVREVEGALTPNDMIVNPLQADATNQLKHH